MKIGVPCDWSDIARAKETSWRSVSGLLIAPYDFGKVTDNFFEKIYIKVSGMDSDRINSWIKRFILEIVFLIL